MWYLVIFIIALLLVSALAPKPNTEKAKAAELGDFKFPRSDEGDPVGWLSGTCRFKSPNTAWYGNLRVEEITEKVKTGLWSSKKVTVGYRYYLGLDLLLCLGPNVTLRRIWAGKYTAWSGVQSAEGDIVINQPNLYGGDKQRGGLAGTCTYYPGNFSQNRDSYLAANVDPNIPRYAGVSHLVFKDFYFGTSSSVEAFNFELSCLTDQLNPGYGIMPNGLDSNPAETLFVALTGSWGKMGMDVSLIDLPSWQASSVVLYNENNGMSLKVESAVPGKKICEEVMRQTDGILYQDPESEKIIFKLLRQDYIIDDLEELDVSIIKDIKNFSKSTWDDTFNQCRVTFSNRANEYKDGVAIDQDLANINFQAKVRNTGVSFPSCCDGELAAKLAKRTLSVFSVPLYKCEITCTRAASFLRPGDVFILNWEPFRLTGMVMRVQKIDLGDLTNGLITMTVIQDKFAANVVTFSAPEASSWVNIDSSAKAIAHRTVFEAPKFFLTASGYTETSTQAALYAVARRPSSASVNFDAQSSFDSFVTEYRSLDDISYGPSARLLSGYSSSNGGTTLYDTTVGITIYDLDVIDYLQQSTDRSTTTDGRGLFVINNEIFSYRTYTDNEDDTYTLSGISRGFLDTIPASHSAGDYVYFITGVEGLSDTLFTNTLTVTTKLLDNTPTSTLAESAANSDTVVLDQRAYRPAAPTYLTIEGSRTPAGMVSPNSITLAWRERNRLATVLVWYDDATQTAEAGTTYQVWYRKDGGSWTKLTGISGATYELDTVGLFGTIDISVYSERDSLISRIGDTLTINLYEGSGLGYALGAYLGGL